MPAHFPVTLPMVDLCAESHAMAVRLVAILTQAIRLQTHAPSLCIVPGQVGVDGKEDNVNGRPLYYTSYQAKGVDKKALTALVVAGDGPGLPLGHVDNYRYLACHKGKNGARYKVHASDQQDWVVLRVLKVREGTMPVTGRWGRQSSGGAEAVVVCCCEEITQHWADVLFACSHSLTHSLAHTSMAPTQHPQVVMYDPVGVGESKLKSGDVIDADHNSELLSVSYRGREFQTVAEHFADSRPYVGVGVGTGAATLVQCVLDCGDDAKTVRGVLCAHVRVRAGA